MNLPFTPPGHEPIVAPAEQRHFTPEQLISALLRYGVLTSLGLVFLGTGISLFNHPEYFHTSDALERLTAPPHGPHRLSEVMADVMEIRGQAVVMVGLLVLMLIPVLRVALSLFVFRLQKDATYVRLTAFVLALLVVAFAMGGAE